MQTVSLLRGLGEDAPTSRFAIDRTQLITTAAPQMTIAEMQNGTCSADGQFVWVASTPTTPGHWERRRAGQACTAVSSTSPDVREGGGGVTVTDEQGNVVDTRVQVAPPPTDISVFDAKVQSGTGKFVLVGAFKFPAEVERSAFTIWGGNKLSPEWQAALMQAMNYPTGSKVAMPPGLAYYFDNPPAAFNEQFFGLVRDARPDKHPTWKPIAKAKHPINGKDYGVFVGITARYPKDMAMNDPAQGPFILTFVWAPIDKAWYVDVWDWIVELATSIIDFVCEKISDPAAAATVSTAATAGGPVTVGVATGAALLCQKPPPGQPTQDQPPAIEPKSPTWPYFLAGGLALAGVVAFILIPPKKKPT